jgi:polyhydroxyalkanoate synthase
MDSCYHPEFLVLDVARRTRGEALARLGFGPVESPYEVRATGPGWRLRDYGDGPRGPVLVIAAPIKRPYIWDLEPSVSVVRRCLDAGFGVRLLEWTPPDLGGAPTGLDDYVAAIGQALGTRGLASPPPVLLGHSLGGTLAAVYGAYDPARTAGVVLVGAPVCFAPGTSRFRDAVAGLQGAPPAPEDLVPGSLLSQASACLAPSAFVWSRVMDRLVGLSDPHALATQLRVERWTLEEVPLPGLFMRQVLAWLYQEDRFHAATLPVKSRTLGAGDLAVPVLGVTDLADEVAPRAAVEACVAAAPPPSQLLEYPGERGVGLQHVALLAGRRAHALVWPRILAWIATVTGEAA